MANSPSSTPVAGIKVIPPDREPHADPDVPTMRVTSVSSQSSLQMPSPKLMKRNSSQLSVRIDTYRGVNAFQRKPFSCYEKTKMVLMVITGVVIIRLVLLLLVLLLMYIFSIFVTCCNRDLRQPLACWRKPFQWCMYLGVRICLFIIGFYWLSTTDTHKFKQSECRVIVSNHHTVFDGFLLWWIVGGTAASKIENKRIPLAGRIADAFQTIWIDRFSSSGRKDAIQHIIDHANNRKLPPLVVFPQGVCSAIGTLTTFKKGAFLPGLPVQPVALDWYWNFHADFSFVTQSAIFELFYGMCQFINFITIDFLDEYVPTDEEKHNPLLYANNVRERIVTKLGIVSTSHSLSDYVLLKHAHAKDAKFDTSKFVMEDITEKLLFRTQTVTKLSDKYQELDLDNDGFINYLEFAKGFKRDPHSNAMKNLFRLFNTKSLIDDGGTDMLSQYMDYDKIKDKKIGFEDFLVGVSVCFVDSMIEDGARIMFDGVNVGDDAYIMKAYVVEAYKRSKVSNLHWHDPVIVDYGDSDHEHEEHEEHKLQTQHTMEEEQKMSIYDEEMEHFVEVVFKDDTEKVDFETFYRRVLKHDQQAAVHHFLQMIITFRLGIKLTESDFIDESKITVKVDSGEWFTDRSHSLRR